MFAEAQLKPSSNTNSNIQNKRSSTNGYYKPDRQQEVDYRSTDYKLGNVLQQKPVMPKTEINSSIELNNSREFTNPMECLQLKANMFTKGENQASNIIQRKIGFEFQTNCSIYKYENYAPTKLDKDTEIINGKLVDIKADDSSSSSYSDVEFITKPLINYDEVKAAEKEMHDTWADVKKNNVEKRDKINGNEICMFDDELEAKPQVTFGTSLSNIRDIAIAAKKVREAYSKETTYLDLIEQTIDTTSFGGLVSLIKSYIRSSLDRVTVEYPKMITDSFLLSRTNFALLLGLCKDIPPTIEGWLANFKEFDIKAPLFPHIKEESGYEDDIELTIEKWLISLYDEKKDLIADVRDHESMSSMGLDVISNRDGKKEPVGIFELRANQGIIHYLDKSKKPTWFEFMDYWYKVIENTGYLPPST